MHDAESILIVEDDPALRSRLAGAFRDRGLDVRTAATVEEAGRMADADPPELVLLDLRVGGDSGISLIPALKRTDPGTRVVVLTGYGSIATAVQAIQLGAVHYLMKPADVDDILAAFARGAVADPEAAAPRPMSLERIEWEHINRVLSDCGGNVSEAARQLGLHRRTLQRKLAKYPVSR